MEQFIHFLFDVIVHQHEELEAYRKHVAYLNKLLSDFESGHQAR